MPEALLCTGRLYRCIRNYTYAYAETAVYATCKGLARQLTLLTAYWRIGFGTGKLTGIFDARLAG